MHMLVVWASQLTVTQPAVAKQSYYGKCAQYCNRLSFVARRRRWHMTVRMHWQATMHLNF